MKASVFCILCLILAFVVNANADNQMKQDLHKMQQITYSM